MVCMHIKCITMVFPFGPPPPPPAKMGDMPAAAKSFAKALGLAEVLKDEASQEAIRKALQDVSGTPMPVQENNKEH